MLRRCVLCVSLLGCGTSYVSTKSPDAHLTSGHTAPDVRAAILRALVAQHDATESEEAGKIIARIGKPDNFVRVVVEYSDTQYVIRYLNGTWREKPGADGDVLVEKKYAAVTKKLDAAVASELDRPAREQAAAEKNQRDYELLLQSQRTAQAQAEAQAAQAPPPAPAPPDVTVSGVVNVVAPVVVQNIPAPTRVEHRSTVRQSEQTLTCCINGALYNCPSQAAFKQCFQSGPSSCTPAGRCK